MDLIELTRHIINPSEYGINRIIEFKKACVLLQLYDRAAYYRDIEKELKRELEKRATRKIESKE